MTIEKTFDNTNRGALFKNTDKTDDKRADYRGEIDVNGIAHWLNCWIRTSKKRHAIHVVVDQAEDASRGECEV